MPYRRLIDCDSLVPLVDVNGLPKQRLLALVIAWVLGELKAKPLCSVRFIHRDSFRPLFECDRFLFECVLGLVVLPVWGGLIAGPLFPVSERVSGIVISSVRGD